MTKINLQSDSLNVSLFSILYIQNNRLNMGRRKF